MFKRFLTATLLLFTFMGIIGLTGCSTVSPSTPNYTGKYNYNQVSNLPKDYPTRYLPDGNLWDEFRQRLEMPTHLERRDVQAQIRWYQTHQDYLNRSLTRGAQYFYYIYHQTKERRLPAELSLIPVFESGYVPVGKSNVGAVGLWQFMPGTAANFKIRMNHWYDGRRDVIVSTNEALKYFTYLYYYFDRDWLLAIAAYNWGPGNVQMAILRNKRHGAPTNYWSLRMPQETRTYVPQLLALAAIMKNPGKYGVSIVPINNGPYFDRVDVGRQISLDKVAKMSGTSEWSMRMLNAGYSRGVTDPNGPYALLLPRSKIKAFKDSFNGKATVIPTTTVPSNLASVSKAIPIAKTTELLTNEQINEQLAKGETSKSINAEKTDVSTATDVRTDKTAPALLTANVAKERREDLNAVDDADDEDDSSNTDRTTKTSRNKTTHEVNKNTRHTNKIVASRQLNQAKKDAAAKISSNTKQYVVGHGETLYSIARQYDTSAQTLRQLNHLSTNNIKPQQVLLIPLATITPDKNVDATSKSESKTVAVARSPNSTHKTTIAPIPSRQKVAKALVRSNSGAHATSAIASENGKSPTDPASTAVTTIAETASPITAQKTKVGLKNNKVKVRNASKKQRSRPAAVS